jgi:endonuclease/exonuclease/phosphatase family metal-dependent hydrolase
MLCILITGKTAVRVLYHIRRVVKKPEWLIVWGLLLTGCGRLPEEKTFSVMTYNLRQYALMDRDDDGQADDPKPPEARAAVVRLIAARRPDVLALQEMGGDISFSNFRKALDRAGAAYPYAQLLRSGRRVEANLAVLSRFPIVAVRERTNEWYSIGPAKVPVTRGFLDVDIQVNPSYRFRLINAHLKSKVYSPLGQTEMRRNEARLLNKVVRSILDETPEVNLLVAGDMNDHCASAPLREVKGRRGGELTDLRPVDPSGAA